MIFRFFVFSFSLFASLNSNGQTTKIDSIPFSLDSRLLVFKGKVNGHEIQFAFDTGAESGVANSKNVEVGEIKILKQGTSITDANKEIKKISDIKVNKLEIGSFEFKNIKDHTFDMPYLYCADLYLLGQNVIKKLNWKIDFEKELIYISESPFITKTEEIIWPITQYKGDRPYLEFRLTSKTYKNLLVDTGFTGIFELDSNYSEFKNLYLEKQKLGKSQEMITSSMGLTGLGKPALTRKFKADSLQINKIWFKDLSVTINPKTEPKIGILFFKNYCKTTTFNFSTNTISMELRSQTLAEKPLLDGRISIIDGKFVVTGKSLFEKSSASELQMNEEIASMNNKKVGDFKDECEFLLWMYQFAEDQMVLEKLNGKKITLRRGE